MKYALIFLKNTLGFVFGINIVPYLSDEHLAEMGFVPDVLGFDTHDDARLAGNLLVGTNPTADTTPVADETPTNQMPVETGTNESTASPVPTHSETSDVFVDPAFVTPTPVEPAPVVETPVETVIEPAAVVETVVETVVEPTPLVEPVVDVVPDLAAVIEQSVDVVVVEPVVDPAPIAELGSVVPPVVDPAPVVEQPTTNLDYGKALEAIKAGRLVARAGWNGKGMFIFMRPGNTLTFDVIDAANTIPQAFKDWARAQAFTGNGDTSWNFTPYLLMKAADNTIVNGWLASQTDMLSEDWCILK